MHFSLIRSKIHPYLWGGLWQKNIFCPNASIFVDVWYFMLFYSNFRMKKYYLKFINMQLLTLLSLFFIFLCRNLNKLGIKYQKHLKARKFDEFGQEILFCNNSTYELFISPSAIPYQPLVNDISPYTLAFFVPIFPHFPRFCTVSQLLPFVCRIEVPAMLWYRLQTPLRRRAKGPPTAYSSAKSFFSGDAACVT